VSVRPAQLAPVVRLAAGATIAAFGVGKFTRHAAEAASCVRYGIPFADVTTYAVGALELVGGVLLALGLGTRLVAQALAGNFAVAIATAGRIEGGPVHLVLAPTLLGCMSFLVATGPGAFALGGRARRPSSRSVRGSLRGALPRVRRPGRNVQRRSRDRTPPCEAP
jgi:putative oxidoreductase